MTNGIRFVLLNDFLPVRRLISGGRIYYEFHLVFYLDEQLVSIGLSLDKLYGCLLYTSPSPRDS